MAARKVKRTSCGFCQFQGKRRHENCPGSIPRAAAGKDWVCWCSENGHPDVIPPAPVTLVLEEDGLPADGLKDTVGAESEAFAQAAASAEPKAAKSEKEKAERCGAPTSKGPCKRVKGHTRGHDAR